MRRGALLAIAWLLAALPARADDAALAEKRAKLEKLVEERDAARMKANIYVLPVYKLEAEAKQAEIDALEKEIAELEKGGAAGEAQR